MEEINIWLVLSHDPKVMGHEFVQDGGDVPGGCAVCWKSIKSVGDLM